MKKGKLLTISLVLVMLISAAGLSYNNVIARPARATSPSLGAASGFSALAAVAASSATTTTLAGNLGLSPGVETSKTGTWVVGGSEYYGPLTAAADAQSAALTAYNNLAGQGSDGSWSLASAPLPGVWTTASSATFADTLTLTGGYDDVWVFQVGASLTFSGSVVMGGDAQACHVFWQVAEDTTIASGASFIGTIISENNITLVSGANVSGRVISLNGALTTDNNLISMPPCDSAPAPTDVPVPTDAPAGQASVSSPEPNEITSAGVPSTGGAPLRGDGTLWVILGFITLSGTVLYFAFQKFNRRKGSS